MPKYQIEIDGAKYMLESDQELSGAELEMAAMDYMKEPSRQAAPQTIGQRLGQRKANIHGAFSAPELYGIQNPGADFRAFRAASQAAGAVDDFAAMASAPATKAIGAIAEHPLGGLVPVVGPAIKAGKNIAGAIGRAAQTEPAQEAIAGAQGLWDRQPEGRKEFIKDAAQFASWIPIGKVGKKGAVAASQATGEGVESAGKNWFKGQLKIEKPLARKVAKNISDAKDKIANTISTHKLESLTGNFDDLARRADELYAQKAKAADAAIKAFEASNPEQRINALDLFGDLEIKISQGQAGIPDGEIESAIKAVQKEFDSQLALGRIKPDGTMSLSDAVAMKRGFNKGGKLFKNSPYNIAADPTKSQIRESLYLGTVEKLSDLVPASRQFNLEAKDLKFVKDAAETAAARRKNKNWIGTLSDIGILGAGATGVYTRPENAIPIIAASAALAGGRRAISEGRGPAALIKVGRALQRPKKWSTYQDLQQEFVRQKGKGKQKGLLDPLKNERGAVGADDVPGSNLSQNLNRGGSVDSQDFSKTLKNLWVSSDGENMQKAAAMFENRYGKTWQEQANNFKKGVLSKEDWEIYRNINKEIADTNLLTKKTAPQIQQIGSGKFKQWFGDWEKNPKSSSKVIAPDGTPQIVYHGSPNKNIAEFDLNASTINPSSSGNNAYGSAFFTNNKGEAGWYSEGGHYNRKGQAGKVYEVYLDIKRPYRTGDPNMQNIPSKQELIEQGYDGIIVDFRGDDKWYVPFSPTQIKSATGNSGAFSPTNPNIRGFSAPAIMAGTGAAAAGGLTAGAILQKKFEQAKKRKKGR